MWRPMLKEERDIDVWPCNTSSFFIKFHLALPPILTENNMSIILTIKHFHTHAALYILLEISGLKTWNDFNIRINLSLVDIIIQKKYSDPIIRLGSQNSIWDKVGDNQFVFGTNEIAEWFLPKICLMKCLNIFQKLFSRF